MTVSQSSMFSLDLHFDTSWSARLLGDLNKFLVLVSATENQQLFNQDLLSG